MPLHSSVICKLAEDGFKDSVIYVIDEDDEQDGPQDQALGNTTDDTSEEGFVAIYTNCLKPVCEEVFDPVVNLAFNSVTGELFQENIMVDFIECLGKVQINYVAVITFL